MRLALLHRRLTIFMGLAGLMAFAAGAGFEPISAALAFFALMAAIFWQPSARLSVRMEPAWLPLAALLVARALWHVFVVGDDVVVPVVDLLLLLLCAESLRALDAPNDTRLYALSFALLVASTAYRPGIFFAMAFVAYVTLATVALTLGHLRRKAQRYRLPEPAVDRALVGATAALGSVVLLTSVVVFLAFPRVTRGFSGRGDTPVTEVAGFSDQVSIGEFGSQIYANPQIVLRVEFPSGAPTNVNDLRWRGRSYDRFNGMQWSHSFPTPPSNAPRAWYRERWQGPVIEQRIFAAPLEARVLFALHPVLRLDSDRRTAPMIDQAGDMLYFGSAAPVYTARSMTGPPPAEELRLAGDDGLSRRVSAYYVQLPARLPERIGQLADSLTAGLTNRYDRAMAIERHLRSLTYTLQLPRTAREATLDSFLFERKAGHCEYFSTAMVVMLRTLGIPSREVNGFRGGQWSEFGEYLAVTQNNAHSWVEVWFPEYGWVPFDPTPGATGGAAATAWFWPGRFLFDAIQHRWNKWVLDYSQDNQFSMLNRIQGYAGGEAANEDEGEGAGRRLPWLWIAALVGVGGALYGLKRGGRAHPAETRAYLRLLESCRRAGLVGPDAVGPLELVESLEARGHPAAGPARSLVDLYLRARFGGQPLDDRERRALGEALGRARTHLRPA